MEKKTVMAPSPPLPMQALIVRRYYEPYLHVPPAVSAAANDVDEALVGHDSHTEIRIDHSSKFLVPGNPNIKSIGNLRDSITH
jgi:hypothetical protein